MTDKKISMLSSEFFRRMRLGAEISSDENEQQNMKSYIVSGERYLNLAALGSRVDYTADAFAKDLLYNWCLYARSDSTEIFKEKWLSSLMELQLLAITGKLVTEKGEEENEKNTEQS